MIGDAEADLRRAAPLRRRTVRTPVAINAVEWGRPEDPPLALIHGGGDFARTFDGFAPLLAAAGWRVVAWDQRGHGDSGRAALYSWIAELRDAVAVLESCGAAPLPVVGHSKGGVMALELAVTRPDLVDRVVAIDGFTRRQQLTGPPVEAAARWLDGRLAARVWRSGARSELVERRRQANPRLPAAWIEHLVEVGAEEAEPGRWRWKLDPAAYPSPPHPWPLTASLALLERVPRPALGLAAGVEEPMAGQPAPSVVAAHLAAAPDARLEVLDGLGHFAHIEDPARVAAIVADFVTR